MKKITIIYCSIAAFLIMFAIGCATSTTAPPAANASTSAAPTATAVANGTSALFAKIAAFNSGVANITPAQIQADSVKLQAQISAFNAAAAPVANTLAGVASIAATATGNPEIAVTIGLANGAIQAANAITKAIPPVSPATSLPGAAPIPLSN